MWTRRGVVCEEYVLFHVWCLHVKEVLLCLWGSTTSGSVRSLLQKKKKKGNCALKEIGFEINEKNKKIIQSFRCPNEKESDPFSELK